jgi:hypothetical protein
VAPAKTRAHELLKIFYYYGLEKHTNTYVKKLSQNGLTTHLSTNPPLPTALITTAGFGDYGSYKRNKRHHITGRTIVARGSTGAIQKGRRGEDIKISAPDVESALNIRCRFKSDK